MPGGGEISGFCLLPPVGKQGGHPVGRGQSSLMERSTGDQVASGQAEAHHGPLGGRPPAQCCSESPASQAPSCVSHAVS